jgi:hypothetical protein
VLNRDRKLRLEALMYLVAARLALKIVPFRWLVRVFEREPRTPELQGAVREQARTDVRRAVRHATRWLPGTVCFPKAIAAQAMLRRRAVATTLYCGAANVRPRGLVAHVWLQDGEIGVAGDRVSGPYHLLASYSAATRSKT